MTRYYFPNRSACPHCGMHDMTAWRPLDACLGPSTGNEVGSWCRSCYSSERATMAGAGITGMMIAYRYDWQGSFKLQTREGVK